MMGMDHNQRSNAVGFGPSYLPDGEGSRNGGGTYSGNPTEPTIQDYENFFGPSARDIKTDLQRFKRHGRWHLPDVLQGPNPWLTDRIDGLITDATNSPFTTKILPYRFKEEVDGKIKWNVWSFDEGMASRVPYESAARTLTQSKRSFAGYMVRQGMAIVLEHNFMMSPKGRENFKNQLNQLIGSIQYTNDLDVHMALILAPSYQKTMLERYYTNDKSASQMCREFADLFGMMQKNVNALDILIEEGKAILRTWGGPMPDFLLCNSKLTFQMTMTPEKTNYITQGIDGVKRLRAGPDLGSYRGLSVIHTRSFVIETGQHPRDMLRRRVRTAEYYRILPNKKNVSREFEFYNEERDTWFTLSFHDLLKYARYLHNAGSDSDNASQIDAIYHGLSGQPSSSGREFLSSAPSSLGARVGDVAGACMLGRRYTVDEVGSRAFFDELQVRVVQTLANLGTPLATKFVVQRAPIRAQSKYDWYLRGLTSNLGIHIIGPRDNAVWESFNGAISILFAAGPAALPQGLCTSVLGVGGLMPGMLDRIYLAMKHMTLNDPFSRGATAVPGTASWYAAYTFYLEIFRRGGLPLDYVDCRPLPAATPVPLQLYMELAGMPAVVPDRAHPVDITCQFLTVVEAVGSVNHPFHLMPASHLDPAYQAYYQDTRMRSRGAFQAHTMLLTSNVLSKLLCKYSRNGVVDTGINHLCAVFNGGANVFGANPMFLQEHAGSLIVNSRIANRHLEQMLEVFFNDMPNVDAAVPMGELLARAGVSTIPMYATSMTHLFHPSFRVGAGGILPTPYLDKLRELSSSSYGHLNIEMLDFMRVSMADLQAETVAAIGTTHPWFSGSAFFGVPPVMAPADIGFNLSQFFDAIRSRIVDDPVENGCVLLSRVPPDLYVPSALVPAPPLADFINPIDFFRDRGELDRNLIVRYYGTFRDLLDGTVVSTITNGPMNVSIDLSDYFDATSPVPFGGTTPRPQDVDRLQDVEIVVIRPNIEHNMLGVIMGLGGNELGNTLWGQTELSVYDDSMHGIWGMSYKYHERAIVFNEKNLIRMWDIAYDGYNGGKDDTYVDWTDEDDERSNSVKKFKDATQDLSKNYRGPSMMVMAFVHDRKRIDDGGGHLYDKHFRRNWPSPIVFYDTYDENNPQQQREVLPIDYDNVQTVDVDEFRVFNNQLYTRPYRDYREMMPEFKTLHTTRKTAGQSSADAETGTDCLAFQGSMRIKEGGVIQEIQGSGHHGPDYVGVASVRAGKGQKVSGQAPLPYRIV